MTGFRIGFDNSIFITELSKHKGEIRWMYLKISRVHQDGIFRGYQKSRKTAGDSDKKGDFGRKPMKQVKSGAFYPGFIWIRPLVLEIANRPNIFCIFLWCRVSKDFLPVLRIDNWDFLRLQDSL